MTAPKEFLVAIVRHEGCVSQMRWDIGADRAVNIAQANHQLAERIRCGWEVLARHVGRDPDSQEERESGEYVKAGEWE